MIVAFCGNATVRDAAEVEAWLLAVIPALIAEGADEFYVGGKGAFDALAARAVQRCKARYPQVRVTLVQAYMDQPRIPELHDDLLYPSLEGVPRRFAMPRRNRYMVQAAAVLVSYVWDRTGNAQRICEYAHRLGKRVISYPQAI